MSTDSRRPVRARLSALGDSVRRSGDSELLSGIALSLPYLTVFALFLLYPLVRGLYMSLFEWNPFVASASTFVWFDNYVRLFNDPLFWTSLQNTVWFVVLTVPTLVVLGLGLALGVNRGLSGGRFLRVVFFSPYLLTVSVVSIIWMETFALEYGWLNYYLDALFGVAPQWLNSPDLAMPAVAIATLWWTVGFNFVILLAARQSVPEELYDAVRLDGANAWQAFRLVTLPQLRNAITFVVIVQFVASFQIFGQVYVMTDGGPGYATETIVLYLYRTAFVNQELGYAAAIGYVLFGILVAISIGNFRLIGGDDV